MTCIFDAPKPIAASLIDGGTAFMAALLAMIMVGSVIKVSTMPPTKGADRGKPNKLIIMAKPSKPKTMEGTAARLLILISIMSVKRFFGANSSK